jgi:midasin (ATPase involved in ribosome maturation)
MNLFEIKDYNVTFSPQALTLKPFKAIWDGDKSKDKNKAINELSLVFYMADHTSDFAYIVDEDIRLKEIIKNLSLPKGYKVSKKIQDAIEFYKDHSQTVSSRLLSTARLAVHKIEEFIKDASITDTNLKKIFDSAKQLPELSETIDKLEDQIKKQQENKSNARGSITKAEFEDGGF